MIRLQVRFLIRCHGLTETQARVIADLYYGEVK